MSSTKPAASGLQGRVQELEQQLQTARAELEEARARLAEASSARGHFLNNVSHELRTPLTTIVGFTGVLLDRTSGPLNADQVKQLELIQTAGSQLLTLINDLVDLVHLEAGGVEVTRVPVDLFALLTELKMALEEAADNPAPVAMGITGVDQRLVLPSDATRLRQILWNVCRQAMRCTRRGRIDVEVSLTPPDALTITVRDHGEAMSPEELNALFERFRQLSQGKRRTGSSVFKGAGLSLAVAAGLARQLGGSLHAASKAPTGNVYSLRLPFPAGGGPTG